MFKRGNLHHETETHCQPLPHLLLKSYSNEFFGNPKTSSYARRLCAHLSLDLCKNVNTHLWVILHLAALEQTFPSLLLSFSFLPTIFKP